MPLLWMLSFHNILLNHSIILVLQGLRLYAGKQVVVDMVNINPVNCLSEGHGDSNLAVYKKWRLLL